MKTKYFFLAALAATALASCTSDDFIADAPPVNVEETMTPILFSSNQKAFTRADYTGAEAAALLGNQFVVSGYKGEATANVGSIVFDNYLVVYEENTAHTTESNVANWEYVGKGRIKHAIDNGITSQTIKYWDYSKPQYDFIAWSTGNKTAVYEGTPAAGQVLVSAITPATATTQAYTFEGTAADLQNCYVADLVTIKKSEYANYQENPVTFRFRQLGTKVRIGIFETIPGYSVKDVEFYSAAASNDAAATPARLFTTTANDIYTEGVYTVYYPTVDDPSDADNNQAHITFAPKSGSTQSTLVSWGALNYTIAEEGEKTPGNVFLGRTSNTATFAGNADDNYYVVFLPNETGTNLNLRVNYTLESIDGSGEEIVVKGATAQVPLIYTTWKPGFAYTYLFKISDKTNGHTGVYDPTNPDDTTVNSDPAGLYPITFDAVVVNAEDDAIQETITTVSAPSITTYQKGSTVVNDDEYQAATGDIFVTVNDGETESTPDLANGKLQTLTDKAALYTLEAGKTEADVVDALSFQDDDAATGTIKGRSGLVLTEAAYELVDEIQYGVDGNTISVGTEQALRFEPAAGTYAFVYTKEAATTTTDMFQPVTKAVGDDVEGLYRYDYKASAGDAQKGVKYFSLSGGTYTMETPFVGQGVGNLYLDATGTIASGLAVTGTTYYYTVDNGMTYTAAHNVEWKANCLQGLYEEGATPGSYEATTDATPEDGKAYYYHDTDKYIYCVFTPQQTDSWYELDETAAKVACAAGETAIDGQVYFDKYTKNNGVRYAKVIKVQ